MSYTIHIFAGLADLLGGSVISIQSTKQQMTAEELIQEIGEQFPEASEALRNCFVAKNQAYAGPNELLSPDDEIALIPPVSGGRGEGTEGEHTSDSETPLYVITYEPIQVEEVTQKVIHPHHGAVLSFVGTTREFTNGQRTVLLEYEAYVPMALKTMEQIGTELAQRWPGTRCAITHRLGRVDLAEISVVIAVSSPHRAECYEASRYAIERLKQIVPIWKKEVWEDGSEWKGQQNGPWNPTAGIEDDEEVKRP